MAIPDEERDVKNTFSRSAGKDIDRGRAWLALVASFAIMVLYGSVVPMVATLYIHHLEVFDKGDALTACIGSLLCALACFCGPLAGWICTRFNRRVCVMVGGILVSASLAISSTSNNFWLVLFFNGVVAGVGLGLSVTPSLVNIGCYFSRRRSLASGICVMGFPLGIFTGTPCLQLLGRMYGWRGALLIYAGAQLNLCVAGATMRPSSQENGFCEIEVTKTGQADVQADHQSNECIVNDKNFVRKHQGVYTNIPLYFYVIEELLANFSINIVYVHLQRYVYLRGGTDADTQMLFLVLGLSGCASKLLAGLSVGDGKKHRGVDKTCLLLGSMSIVAAAMFMFPHFAYTQIYRNVLVCVIGFYYNVSTVLYIPFCLEIAGLSNLNAGIGFSLFGVGFGFLTGPPTAAYITELTNNYDNAFYLAGGVNLLAAVSLVLMTLTMPRRAVFQPPDKSFQEKLVEYDLNA